MVDKKGQKSGTTGNIHSSATPADDLDVVAKKPVQYDNYDRKASKEDKDELKAFLLMHLIENETNSFKRQPGESSAIEDALRYYDQDMKKANDEDLDSSIAAHDAHPNDYDSDISYTGGGYYPGAGGHYSRPGHKGATVSFGNIDQISVGEKQARVLDVLNDAAVAAGVNVNTMRGLWFVETRFSTIKELSTTGCSGAWQFCRGTWAEQILKHGDQIAARLAAKGFTDDAAIALKYHNALVNKQISVNDAGLQSQRFNGHIATYAASYYAADIAKGHHLNAADINDGGKIYAAYNVGSGSLFKLIRMAEANDDTNAMSALGKVARLNPMFYRHDENASEALANYQAAVENGGKQFGRAFGIDMARAPVPTQNLASAKIDPKADNPLSKVFHHADAIKVPPKAASTLGEQVSNVASNVWQSGQKILSNLPSLDLRLG